MLYQLAKYAQTHDISCLPGYCRKRIRAILTLSEDGCFIQAESCEWPYDLCPTLSFSELIAGGNARSHFLVDTMGTITGSGNTDEKTIAKHRAFVEIHCMAAERIPLLEPLEKMLRSSDCLEQAARDLSDLKVRPTDNVTFRMAGHDRCLVEQDDWKEWWLAYRESLLPGNKADKMRCLVTGEMVEPARIQPKIGLSMVGGNTAKSTLIGFDKDSFTSFGLIKATNAACSEETAAVYAGALVDLIDKAPRPLANTLLLHWLDRPVPPEEDPFGFFTEPLSGEERSERIQATEAVKRLSEAVRTGKRPDFTGNRYHVILISGAAGRAMVRSTFEGDLGDLYLRTDNWLDDLALIGPYGGPPPQPPKLFALLVRTLPYRPGARGKDLKDAMDQKLAPLLVRVWDSILRGSPFPQEAASRALQHLKSQLQRAREDDRDRGLENIDRIACAMLKMWYNRAADHGIITNGGAKVETKLNTGHPSPAYHAGRLLAALNHLQHAALGDVGADVVQRFFSAASVTPGLVIGRLVDGAQPHLNKLRREERMGLYIWYQQMIGEIMSRLDDRLLEQLDFAGQTLFALGYYHQFASLFEKSGNATHEKEEEKNHGSSESV